MYLADESTAIGGFSVKVVATGDAQRKAAKLQAGPEGRIEELERENERLQHLVAELLLANQRLRGSFSS